MMQLKILDALIRRQRLQRIIQSIYKRGNISIQIDNRIGDVIKGAKKQNSWQII